jgi:hypothetical protein
VVGGIVAILAYRKWRRPDDARMRSQTAQEIIRQLRQTEVGVQEARVQGTTVYLSGEEPSIEDKMEEARIIAALPRGQKIGEVDAALRGLELFQVEVDELYKKTKAPEILRSICNLIDEVKKAYTFIAFLDDTHRKMMGDARFEKFFE